MLQDSEDQEATKTTVDKPAEAFSISEIGPRSLERLSGWLDWLAERPVRALGVAAVLVACYIGVASAKWASANLPRRRCHR